jgi:hypothetical protein
MRFANPAAMGPEKQRRSDPGTGTRPARRPDARRDPGKLKTNQARLGVGPEHKTTAMKKGRRGTFP